MKTMMIRKLPDEDYAWMKAQADREHLGVETWLRRLIRELRLGISPVIKQNEVREWEAIK